jgi:parallel beta-helix repeat protein
MPGNCTFVNNTILNMSAGIYLDACRNITIEHNQLKGNAVGVNITALCDPSSVEIHNNDISGNTEYGVNNNYGELRSPLLGAAAIPGPEWVNATYNWWGNTSGPHNLSDPGSTSTGDNVTMYVYYEPWLTKPMYSSTYTYHLVAGWNLVSIPLDVADSSIEGFFPESVGSSIVDIWGWNESTQNWVFYCHDPDSIYYDYYPALTELETGRAYWVDIPVEASFEVQGAVPDGAPQSPVPLVSSWNFIGPTGLSPQTPAGLYQSAVDVWGWDESAQNWIFYCPDPDNMYYDYYPGLTQVQPGHGYWVDMP